VRPYEADADGGLSRHIFGTMRSPGRCVIAGHDIVKNWNSKPAKGSTGASDTLDGDNPRDFTITYSLADDAAVEGADAVSEFDLWDKWQAYLETTVNGPKPFALPIYHPDLARVRITEATIKKIGGRVYDGKGGASHTVTFKEYKPPKKKKAATATGKGANATAGNPAAAKPDPNAAAKAELAALVAQAKKL